MTVHTPKDRLFKHVAMNYSDIVLIFIGCRRGRESNWQRNLQCSNNFWI